MLINLNVIVRLTILSLIAQFSKLSSKMSDTYDYKNIDGFQIYAIFSKSAYLFLSLKKSEFSNNILIETFLYLNQTITELQKTNGLYVGIGFGSNKMDKSDIVIMSYAPNNKIEFNCYDAYGIGHAIVFDNDVGGKEDMKYISGNINSLRSNDDYIGEDYN